MRVGGGRVGSEKEVVVGVAIGFSGGCRHGGDEGTVVELGVSGVNRVGEGGSGWTGGVGGEVETTGGFVGTIGKESCQHY